MGISMASSESTNRESIGLYKQTHIQKWNSLYEMVIEEKGDDLSKGDVIAHVSREYRSVARLRDDKRVRETIEMIADDHGCDPSDLSLEDAFKIAAGAYMGFQQTADWGMANGE